MSLDIDWTLLQPLVSPSSTLLETLNAHLQSTSRPSFIGPISITSLDFGTISPEVELKDIRDVWRAFDKGDDEGDDDAFRTSQAAEMERRRRNRMSNSRVGSPLDDEDYDMVVSPMVGQFAQGQGRLGPRDYHSSALGVEEGGVDMEAEMEMDVEETQSVYSGWSPRQSVAAVGIGAGSISLGGMGSAGAGGGGARGHRPHPSLSPSVSPSPHAFTPDSRPGYGHGHERHQSYYTARDSHGLGHAHSGYAQGHERQQSYYTAQGHLYPDAHAHGHAAHGPRYPSPSNATRHRHSPSPTPPITSSTPPPSPPARPGHLPPDSSSGHGIPSVQLHLHVSHFSDLSITLLTSLQVNYPSPLFMSLPLKLSITGLSISADMVVAYSGAKHRLHLTIVPSDESDSAHDKSWGGAEVPIGQRLLPNLTIESEIGHSDAHVLRNVGKVEKFIADAVRKTLVEELVFPNFQTVAL